jgi:hypothetical protein
MDAPLRFSILAAVLERFPTDHLRAIRMLRSMCSACSTGYTKKDAPSTFNIPLLCPFARLAEIQNSLPLQPFFKLSNRQSSKVAEGFDLYSFYSPMP